MAMSLFKKDKKSNPMVMTAVMIIFVIAVIYCIISVVKSLFNKPDMFYKDNIKSNIDLYYKEYGSTFYILDSQVANFLEAVDKQMYSDLYRILEENYDKIYSKNEAVNILKDYRENIFKYNDGEEHEYKGHVINAYKLDGGNYLVQLDFDDNDFYMILGTGRKSYTFAFVE